MNRFWQLGILAVLGLSSADISGQTYGWPLDAPPALTSTYAEYRSGRFHAGLDVKTWGKEGYTCLAVSDGYVWRVRTSPWGYGKVVYLRLDDGQTAVYAHLSAFTEAIEAVVAEEQDRRGAYSVNLYLPANQIRVKKGDPVAFSGSTGSGFPHLHFEIRDANQRPLNPLRNGFPVKDTMAPTLVEIAFLPLDADSRVDGRGVPQTRALQSADGRDVFGPVSVWGRIGIALKVFDRADASALTNRLAPYRLTLSVDGEVQFRTTYDAFSYDQVREVDLDRSFVMNRLGRKGFHNLYRQRGNSLPLYDGRTIGSGVISAGVYAKPGRRLTRGPHRIEIVAEDAEGNRATASVDFQVIEPAPILSLVAEEVKGKLLLKGELLKKPETGQALIVESSSDEGRTWEWIKTIQVKRRAFSAPLSTSSGPLFRVRAGEGPAAICKVIDEAEAADEIDILADQFEGRTVLKIHSESALAGPPVVQVEPGFEVTTHALTPSSYEAIIPTSHPESTITVTTIDEGANRRDTTFVLRSDTVHPTGGNLISTDGMVSAVFEEAGIYHPFEGRISLVEVAADLPLPVGHAYRFEPGTIPFREMTQIHFKVPPGQDRDRLGVYELTDKGWAFVWNDVDSTKNTVWAGVRHFSTYALLADQIPPEVDILEPKDGSRTTNQPEIRVAMRDSMSGIPMEKLISFKLDQATVVFEYDPELGVAHGILRGPLSTGAHLLEVRVQDTSGNQSVVSSRFVVESE